jgi:quercetin dioxygenase-like cupin family protein
LDFGSVDRDDDADFVSSPARSRPMDRRLFIASALTSPVIAGARSEGAQDPVAPRRGIHVPAGTDRFKEEGLRTIGMISSKVSAQDTGGSLYVFENTDMGKGGPPRHLHHEQDEWFYAIKGEFLFEVGDDKFRLRPGDSLFAPRKVPHVWAYVGDGPGTMLFALSPAGTFETFIRGAAKLAKRRTPEEAEKAFAAHGMKIVGPPLQIE